MSFVPLLHGMPTGSADRSLVWHFPNNWGPMGPGIGASSAIRSKNWKLIYYYEDRRMELFDLSRDLGEQNDLSKERPDTRDRLAEKLKQRLLELDAQYPIDKETGELVQIKW